jgi:uroporphyrinogen-III decarboxylase
MLQYVKNMGLQESPESQSIILLVESKLMKYSREAYIEIMTFGQCERPMFVELFGPLVGLEQEWIAQGASADEVDLSAFDWDFVPIMGCGGNTGILGGFKPVVIEDNAEYLIERDELGRTVKLLKGAATIALPLDFPVRDMDSWLKIKPLYQFNEKRIDWEAVQQAKVQQAQGALVVASIPGGFDTPRELMGDAGACMGFYDQPELLHDILAVLTDTSMQVLERISDILVIDQLSVHEDLAGKSGPLVGPKQIQTFIKPYYRKVWELLSGRGTRIFDMDSDGNVTAVIDAFLDCGLTAMLPMEPAAGMDIVRLRKQYGKRLAVRGGIDKHVLRKDKAAIRNELEYKLQPLMREGGTIFGLDHRIPNGTPLDNYRYYVDTGREILGLPRRQPNQRGWQRMAF